jgi:hypothetical protein
VLIILTTYLKNQLNEIKTKKQTDMITTILIMTIINSLVLVAFLMIFFSIKDAHQETMLYLSRNNNLEEPPISTTPQNNLAEDVKGLSKRVDNIEVKPLHNTTLINQLKSEIVQLKNEILLNDMEDIIPIPNLPKKTITPKKAVKEVKDIENKAFEKLEKIWDNFKKEKKPKKKKKFEWTDKKVKDFANNYNTKAIEGCKDIKDKLEYYKQKNK